MLRFFKNLVGPAEPDSRYIHFHIDDTGMRRVCDESVCRPANDPLLYSMSLPFAPYR